METIANRFRRVAGTFSDRVAGVAPAAAWEQPSPCEGWVARDIVRHLVSWVPGFLGAGAGLELPAGPDVDDDPAAAWEHLRGGLQEILDDPDRSAAPFTNEHTGDRRVDEAIARFVLGDVLVHTWDLARATGQDEALESGEVARMLAGIEPLGDALAKSGHYGLPVALDRGATEQDRLLAATGRRP